MKIQPSENEIQKFRPKPFYFITTTDKKDLSVESVYSSLERVKREGFGGIVLFNKPPHGFDAEMYLSDRWFDMVRNFAEASKELELDLWINDGFDFPPGSVGGRINPEKYPHLTQKHLVLVDDEVVIEEADWGFPAFEEPESAILFHEYVYEVYLQNVGEYFGNPIRGFFSDADNRRVSFRAFQEDSPQRNYFPWSNRFAESFEAKYGYDITPYLKVILKKEKSSQGRDYWEHAGFLYQQWFASNYKWCKEHGLEYTFHTSDTSPFAWEEAIRSSLYTEGRALDMQSNCDYPGTDQELLEINGGKHMRQEEYWYPKVSWGGDDANICNPEYFKTYGDLRAKQAGSTAFLYKKKGAMCEMFAASNWGATPTQLREIATWQIMQGITFIVPHAYHHRFHGETKYFAPPVFFEGSTLNKSARLLNDTLAEYCYYASLGEMKAPIAVLDLTDDIWEGRSSNQKLFEVCDELNRMPYGYVLADMKSIVANQDRIQVVVNTGATLKEEHAKVLADLHISVLLPHELDKLSELIDCKVSYEGEGQPHFMRRMLEKGEELVIIANVQDGKRIQGVLHLNTVSYDVTLESGEMALYTNEGQCFGTGDSFAIEDVTKSETEQSAEQKEITELKSEVSVIWAEENILPVECFENAQGQSVAKHMCSGNLSFKYEVQDNEVKRLKLLIPNACMKQITAIKMDGSALEEATPTKVYDDAYWCYDLSDGQQQGEHTLLIQTFEPLSESERILLQGEFGVWLQSENDYAVFASGSQYSLLKYLPEKVKVILGKRPQQLNTYESWTEQGHPFYSGTATYCWELDMPQQCGEVFLNLPKVHDHVVVFVDGRKVSECIFQPYQCALGDIRGKHVLQIAVTNSMGNAMEYYRASSGIVQGAMICRR